MFRIGLIVTRSYVLNPTSRLSILVSQDVPELGAGTFGADVRVLNYQPIAVEKALYWNADGVAWAAGTNVIAGTTPATILAAWRGLKAAPPKRTAPPLWDGKAAARIVEVLERELAGPLL